MAKFMVSYDLHNSRTYEPVWKALEFWGAVRLLELVWLVSLNSTASEVRDSLQKVIDGDDLIAVLELKEGSFWATLHAKAEGISWLKKNILS